MLHTKALLGPKVIENYCGFQPKILQSNLDAYFYNICLFSHGRSPHYTNSVFTYTTCNALGLCKRLVRCILLLWLTFTDNLVVAHPRPHIPPFPWAHQCSSNDRASIEYLFNIYRAYIKALYKADRLFNEHLSHPSVYAPISKIF